MSQMLGGFACMSFGNDAIAEAHRKGFLRTDRTTSED
jgi:hypothetical protein